MESDSDLPHIQTSRKKENANWNDNKTLVLITFFEEAMKTSGSANFKMATFNTAAIHVGHLHTSGPIKTGTHAKSKWDQVRLIV